MASVKTTYSLDSATLKTIERLARSWQVSKTEVLRRVLQQAAESERRPTAKEKIAALHALQKSLQERRVDFDGWMRTIREGRR